jgi:hypothetical protein
MLASVQLRQQIAIKVTVKTTRYSIIVFALLFHYLQLVSQRLQKLGKDGQLAVSTPEGVADQFPELVKPGPPAPFRLRDLLVHADLVSLGD